ncbi:MAG TPA: carboxypeptidase-like regulatory domain-containing protein [Planctomycetota bacterium]|nr:carboxypeptidase-like regulatory domain-containing protein [Planctomycetota bacterium]
MVQKSGTTEFRKFTAEKDGTQLLQGLPKATYGVRVEYDDAIPYDGEVVIDGADIREATIDLKAGARISGTVADKAGHPISQTRVFLVDQLTRSPASIPEVTTNSEGSYALRGVSAGLYQVRFRHAVFQPLDRSDVLVRSADDHQQVDVVLALGSRLSGRVVDDSNQPIEGAMLVAGNGSSGGTAKSGPDGSFAVSGLTDAPSNLSAAKQGYGKVVLRNLPGNTADVLLRLPKSGTLVGRLRADVIPKKMQIVLSRYDEDLRQVIPAETRFLTRKGDDPPDELPPGGRHLITSVDGAFSLPDLSPGTYWIDVQAEGYERIDQPQIVIQSGQSTPEVLISLRKKN